VKQAGGAFTLEPDASGFFTSHDSDGRFVTYYGDNHPRYNGNVVKAMASAKDGYPHVVALFAAELAKLDPAAQPAREGPGTGRPLHDTCSRASSGRPPHPTIVEVTTKARRGRHFHPGQFYLQNSSSGAARADDRLDVDGGIALTGAWVDREQGRPLITLEMGVSSRLSPTCSQASRWCDGGPARPPRFPKGPPCCWRVAGLATPCSSRLPRR
jgi:hypothetical protein